MASLRIQFKKGKDSPTTLTCVRGDGTFTTRRIGRHEGYGPLHDLAHYVVESTFGFTEGFYGLLAQGWDIEDFERPGAPASLPKEALEVEWLAGQLSIFEGAGNEYSVDGFNEALTSTAVTSDQLEKIQAQLRELRSQWTDLPAGETLELIFEPGGSN